MIKTIFLPEEYKVYRDNSKKELQDRFRASDFVHIKLKSTDLRKIFKACRCRSVAYVEEHYCCNGSERSCWEAPYRKGLWKMSERQVRKNLLNIIRENKPYLQNPERVFRFTTDGMLNIYIFLRDTQRKYDLWIQVGL